MAASVSTAAARAQAAETKAGEAAASAEEAEDYALYLISCYHTGSEILEMSNPGDYPYDRAAALALLQGALEGFAAEELEGFIDAGKVDFIYLNGEMRFHRLFLDTLVKTRPELAPRLKDPSLLDYKKANFAALDAVIREMRQNGGAARRWHVRHALRVKPEYRRVGEEILVHLPLPVE